MRVYNYKVLFKLFNVTDYSRFSKSVFFIWSSSLAPHHSSPHSPPPLRKEPAFVKLWMPSGKLVVMAFEG
jgi:hypothetical protein